MEATKSLEKSKLPESLIISCIEEDLHKFQRHKRKKARTSSSSSWGLALYKAGIFASHMDLNFPLLKCSSLSVRT
jgi:hypothetical protein